jgi:thioredoxin reductase
MARTTYDVAVIGAGPAGIAAALETAAGGASTLLIDAGDTPGGHFYKHPPDTFSGSWPRAERRHRQELDACIRQLADERVDVRQNTSVWGIFAGEETTFGPGRYAAEHVESDAFSLYLTRDEAGPDAVEARVLILAPGVYDRPLPFPGWTLPGVMTPGAVQMMVKRQGILPGHRVLVAGTGPLQMAVAASLVDAGAEVIALLDTCAAGAGFAGLPSAMWGQWERMGEVAGYTLSLLRGRVPVRFGHAVWRALGDPETGVEGVVIGRVDGDGRPIAGTERQVACDTICVAYGFVPAVALTQHLGCQHDYDSSLHAYVPRHDETMATTVPGVFVAGDVTGVGGKPLAGLQGRVAGISALEQLERLAPGAAARRRQRLQPGIRREERFAGLLWSRFRVKEGLLDLATDDTLICRCENVTVGDLLGSIEDGAADLFGIKLRTRLGMGVCQGRYCALNGALLLGRETGHPVSELSMASVRPPILPVRTKDLSMTQSYERSEA